MEEIVGEELLCRNINTVSDKRLKLSRRWVIQELTLLRMAVEVDLNSDSGLWDSQCLDLRIGQRLSSSFTEDVTVIPEFLNNMLGMITHSYAGDPSLSFQTRITPCPR